MQPKNNQNTRQPLKNLIQQAGLHGYLLLIEPVLRMATQRQRTGGDYAAVDESAAIQAGYAIVIGFFAIDYLLSKENHEVRTFLKQRPTVYLITFTGLCMASALWSERIVYTAFMGFQSLAFFLLIVVVLDRLRKNCMTANDIVEWTMFWMVWSIGWAVLRQAIGGYLSYNIFSIGRLQTGIFIFLALYISRRKILNWAVIPFALFTGSNKMYAAMIPGGFLGFFSNKTYIKTASAIGILVIIISLINFGMEPVLQETVWRGRSGVGMEYTSGRDWIWERSWTAIKEKPWLGYGFVVGERENVLKRSRGVINVHNMALSAALGVGILGPILLFLFFIETTVLCIKSKLPMNWQIGFLGTIGVAFIFSMTGPGLGGRVYGAWTATVFAMTMIGMLAGDSRKVMGDEGWGMGDYGYKNT